MAQPSGGSIAGTPRPPYVAVIFTSLRADGGGDGYAETAGAMFELASTQEGFLGVESAREGVGITVSYWRDEVAARQWKAVAEHLVAQRRGREAWYRDYRVRVATVTRDYGPRPAGAKDRGRRRARVEDVHDVAAGLPGVRRIEGPTGKSIYQVGGKSFVFFRTPRADATDPVTGERYDDVIVLWVESEEEKAALLQDPGPPLFTTAHFDGHPSVLVRAVDLGRLGYDELVELVESAWLARASPARAARWLAERAAR